MFPIDRKSYFVSLICAIGLIYTSNAQVVNIENRRLDKTDNGWRGTGELSLGLVRNQNSAVNFATRVSVLYGKDKHRYLLMTDAAINQSNLGNIESIGWFHFRYNYLLKENFSWEGFAQTLFSQQMRLYPRYTLGAGPRYKVFQSDSLKLYVGSSLMFEHENLQNPGASYSSERLTFYFSWVWINKTDFTVDWMFLYQPRLFDFSDNRIQTELRTEAKINKQFRMRFQLSLLYDADPPATVPRVFVNSRTGLMFNF